MGESASNGQLQEFREQLEQNLLDLLKEQGKITYDESGMKMVEDVLIKSAIAAGIYEEWSDDE